MKATLEISVPSSAKMITADQANSISDPMPPAKAVAIEGKLILHGLKILLTEDGLDNQRLISHVLKMAGAEVEIADNGKIGVNKTVAALETRQFDLILMDMQMPTMDGYQASTHLREIGIDTPIIAITAHAMDGDRERCLGAGCTDYTTKPICRKTLVALIHSYTNSEDAATAATTTS